MQDLIDRLEKATGPDRELDFAIFGSPKLSDLDTLALHYTASLDAALTLVPKGWRTLAFEGTGETWGCFLGRIDTNAATPALALCVAALKAQAMVTAAEG